MPRNDDFDALVARVAETGYEDMARIEVEARRLRAQMMRHYLLQAFNWITGKGERDAAPARAGAARHA